MDNATPNAAVDPSRAVGVRRRAVAVLIEQSVALAREGFFVESTALIDAARALMNAVTSDATVVARGSASAEGEPSPTRCP